VRRRRILTWHVHGSYLYYLTQGGRHDYFVPTLPGRPTGYGGRNGQFPWPDNLHEVPAEDVRNLDLDLVLMQSAQNYTRDRHELLSPAQMALPSVYIEHDPPREHPTDTRHVAADDPSIQLVHCTYYNALMWDAGNTPTRVVSHGVVVPDLQYTGEEPRGLVVVNGLPRRGRRLGADLFERVREAVPLDLVGMGSEELGGMGDVSLEQLHELMPRYRFMFSPIRYTSLGLSICEAMMLGVPVIGLATTELPSVIESGISGHVSNDIEELIRVMRMLISDRDAARALGERGREQARRLFNINRFLDDWDAVWSDVTSRDSVGAQLRR
jgi:hypothetical protein